MFCVWRPLLGWTGPVLIKLAYDVGIANVQQKARQRLAELIDQGTITLEQLSADGVDPMAQFSVLNEI